MSRLPSSTRRPRPTGRTAGRPRRSPSSRRARSTGPAPMPTRWTSTSRRSCPSSLSVTGPPRSANTTVEAAEFSAASTDWPHSPMKKPAAPAKLIVTIVALGALVSAWLFFAPGALGGSTTYVVTEGISMHPRFHAGDLALSRSAGSYEVGDVVAYHSHALGTIVLHRIVAHDGSRYVFKGDNNDFIDPERPTADQLVGKLWLQVGGGGRGFLWLGSPKTIAV